MKHTARWVAATASALLSASGLGAAPAQAVPSERAQHQRVVDFWTTDKVAKAVPRDFVRDAKTGKFTQAKGKPGGGTTTTGTTGADWTGGGLVQETTGKVLFAMGGSYYVCSASVAKDANTGTSSILTAAHCVYDETAGGFSSNWMFVPDYDSAPVNLTTSGSFCSQTVYGCWTATALTVHRGYASAGGFNDQATLHDYAFATVGAGGKGMTQLDATVGAQDIAFTAGTAGATTDLFGYPSSKPYKGTALIYSEGGLGYDARNGNQTYAVASKMTQGCSGGPWFQNFSKATGTGTMMSVNSYSYSGSSSMHGPKLDAKTQSLFTASQGATANRIVG